MLTDDQLAALEAAWAPARAAGVLGRATVHTLWEHTAGFASAVCSHFGRESADLSGRLIDVGTGAGVPGLLLAQQLPGCHITLVDANERRLDHVRRARRALGLEDRTTVMHARAEDLATDLRYRTGFDGAVSRLLAEPSDSAELLAPLVRDGGVIVVSTAQRWQSIWDQLPVPELPLGAATHHGAEDRFVQIPRLGPVSDDLPRREKARRRQPYLRG
ncbi:MAG: RsmG family class I SAM-dependent methyltransferase [Actinomycetota bacterium]